MARLMRHFDIDELVAPELLAVLSEEAAWRLIPQHARDGLDGLRDRYGDALYINGRGFHYSGVRPLNCPIGAKLSAHKGYRGLCAFDVKAKDLPWLRACVMEHWHTLHIAEMEHSSFTPSWCHVAFSAVLPPKLKIIKP
jgi:hypothetical protein